MSLITLITDFGISDWFTGEVKGVLYSIAPDSHCIDITHSIAPGDIRGAAFVLKASYKTFPRNTIFCVPVDPVSSASCDPIAIETEQYTFVGPDNGALSWALEDEQIRTIVTLSDIRYFRNPLSMTFRGRDIFAPVAAHLSIGTPIEALGPKAHRFRHLAFPRPNTSPDSITGEILHIDCFGNCITNITSDMLPDTTRYIFSANGLKHHLSLASTYDAVRYGCALLYKGSTGFMEIGLYSGNAAERFGIKGGDPVELAPSQDRR